METTMPRKPFALAAVATASALFLIPTQAAAQTDPAVGAIIGGTFGAAIGHGINGRNGAVVGGVLGALTGASIAANSRYAPVDYSYEPRATYYAPAPTYYAPAPVYYSPPPVVYRTAPVFVRPAYPRPPVYAPIVVARPRAWHAGHHHYQERYGWR
jgi:hypothetical protein